MNKLFGWVAGIAGLVIAGLSAALSIQSVKKSKKDKTEALAMKQIYKNNAKQLKNYNEVIKNVDNKKKEVEKKYPADIISTVIDNNNRMQDNAD